MRAIQKIQKENKCSAGGIHCLDDKIIYIHAVREKKYYGHDGDHNSYG